MVFLHQYHTLHLSAGFLYVVISGYGWNCPEIASQLADISFKYNMLMELEYEKKKGCPVIVGLDIHDPALFLTDEYLNRAMSVCEGLDINWM